MLQRIRQISGEVFDIPQGSLYPALYRLEHQALIVAEWGRARTTGKPSTTPDRPRDAAAAGRNRRLETPGVWYTVSLERQPEEV